MTFRSELPAANLSPVGLKAKLSILSVCPVRAGEIRRPFSVFHKRTSAFLQRPPTSSVHVPTARVFRSLLKARLSSVLGLPSSWSGRGGLAVMSQPRGDESCPP